MAVNKFQGSKLTIDISAKVPHIGDPSNVYTYFFRTIRPIELKFHMKSPYDELAYIYIFFSGHMTKMATTPIYSKTL